LERKSQIFKTVEYYVLSASIYRVRRKVWRPERCTSQRNGKSMEWACRPSRLEGRSGLATHELQFSGI